MASDGHRRRSTAAAAGVDRTRHELDNEHHEDLTRTNVKLLDDLRQDLDRRLNFLSDTPVSNLHQHRDELDALKADVRRAKELLTGAERFLTTDFHPAVVRLQNSLDHHSEQLHRKLNKESTLYNDQERRGKRELESLREITADQETLARVAMEMRELEALSSRMTNQVERLNVALKEAANDAGEMDGNLTQEDHEEKERRKEEAGRKRLHEEEEARKQLEEMERRRIKEEARKRREEEEEREKKIEEERLRKEDPRYWPNVISFPVDGEFDSLGGGVAGVLRAPEGVTVLDTQILCSCVSLLSARCRLAEHEEIVSNVVKLTPAAGHDIHFKSSVWLAIPYIGGSRTKETVIKKMTTVSRRPRTPPEKTDDEKTSADDKEGGRGRRAAEEEEGGGGGGEQQTTSSEGSSPEFQWEDVMTRETSVEGHEHCRFVETHLRHLPAEGITLVVLTRFKRDSQTINNKGGKVVSSVDQRVSVVCPKNAFRLATDISMQTIPLDLVAVAGLKERFEGCEDLLGTSAIVRLSSTNNKPNKPLVYSVAHPSGVSKTKKTKTTGHQQQQQTRTHHEDARPGAKDSNHTAQNKLKINSGQDEPNEMDYVTLLTKENQGRAWRPRDDVIIESQKDFVSFQLPNVVERFVLLRTSSHLEPAQLTKIATNLETSLREKPTAVILRQNRHDPSRVVIECCKRDSVDRIVLKLKEGDFSEGPPPFIGCLREGDVIEVSFSPKCNIEFSDRQPRYLVFCSNITTCKMLAEVKEVDVFAQNALDSYRGKVRLALTDRTNQPTTTTTTTIATGHDQKKPSSDNGLLCELMVVLPKAPKEVTKVRKIRLPITADGPLSEEYFDQLSVDLGDEWQHVASSLKISKASVQRIMTSHAGLDSVEAAQKSIKDMLRDWFLSSTKSKDRADDLRLALLNAGRNDLAEELATKSRDLRQDFERRQEEAILRKCIGAYCSSGAAVRSWRAVAKALGLREDDIRRISGDQKKQQATAEVAQSMLRKWKDVRGREATKDSLIATLKKLKLSEAAGLVSLVR